MDAGSVAGPASSGPRPPASLPLYRRLFIEHLQAAFDTGTLITVRVAADQHRPPISCSVGCGTRPAAVSGRCIPAIEDEESTLTSIRSSRATRPSPWFGEQARHTV